jgi:hypothetical protein
MSTACTATARSTEYIFNIYFSKMYTTAESRTLTTDIVPLVTASIAVHYVSRSLSNGLSRCGAAWRSRPFRRRRSASYAAISSPTIGATAIDDERRDADSGSAAHAPRTELSPMALALALAWALALALAASVLLPLMLVALDGKDGEMSDAAPTMLRATAMIVSGF